MPDRFSAAAFTKTPWLLLVLAAIVSPMATLLVSSVSDIGRQIGVAQSERGGLAYLAGLTDLFEGASDYRAGAGSAHPRVPAERVDREIDAVGVLERRYGLGRDDWIAAVAQWKGGRAPDHGAAFVSSLAELFPAVADRSGLTYDPDVAGIDLADALTYRLPKAIESFQEARERLRRFAGSAGGSLGEDEGRARAYLDDALVETLEATEIEGGLPRGLRGEQRRSVALEAAALAALRIEERSPSDAARSRAFVAANRAIEQFYALVRDMRPALDALVVQRIADLRARRAFREVLGFVAIAAALCAVFFGARGAFQRAEVARMRRVTAELHYHATHDALTGLPNRTALTAAIEKRLEVTHHAPLAIAVLFIDLDNFKLINDSLGHAAGDRVLCHTAAKLEEICAANRGLMVARFGGDEFVMLLDAPDAAAMPARVDAVVDEIACALSQSVTIDASIDHRVVITASVGVAQMEHGAVKTDGASVLLREADAAMYEAKANGRARSAMFGPRMRERAASKLRLMTDLRDLVKRNELELAFEPLVRLDDGSAVASEALVRWQHPQLGELRPGSFLPTAIETGAIVPIGGWVVGEAIRSLASGLSPGRSVHVNLSARELVETSLVGAIEESLARHALDPAALAIEVTESSLVQSGGRAEATLRQLRAIGVKIWLDDFGVEYSSLRYLQRLPVDGVKIDRNFVGGADGRLASPAIVRLILDLARSLELDIIAEGVETTAQRAALLDLGCAMGQGYLFSDPAEETKTGT